MLSEKPSMCSQNEEVWQQRRNLKNKKKWNGSCFGFCAIDLHACSFSREEEKLISATYSQQHLRLLELLSRILFQKQAKVGGKNTLVLKMPFKTAKYRCVSIDFELSYSVPLISSLLQNSSCLANGLRFLEAIVFFIQALLQEEQIDYLKNKSTSPFFSKVWKDNGVYYYTYSVLLPSVTFFLNMVSWEA